MKLDDAIHILEELRAIHGGDVVLATNPTGELWQVNEIRLVDEDVYSHSGAFNPVAQEAILID